MGSAVPSRDVPRLIALYRAGLLPVDRLLTHQLQLDEINTGFDRLARAEAIRQVVRLSQCWEGRWYNGPYLAAAAVSTGSTETKRPVLPRSVKFTLPAISA